MALLSGRNVSLAAFIALAAFFYQYILRDILFVTYGVGRHVQKLSEFPYDCRRITDPRMEACEDMWLDEESRTLFLACSDPISRAKWMPNIGVFNPEYRSLKDHIVALSIDKPTADGSYELHVVNPTSYTGAGGSNAIYLVGLTGRRDPSDPSKIQLYLVNAQPSFSPSNELLDQKAVGGNSTIEVFSITPSSTELRKGEMKHVRTFHDPQIATPNNVAVMPDGSFYYTNDHGLTRTGWRHETSPILRTGDVSHCTATSPPICKRVASGFAFPNGLHYSPRHGKLFVPSAALGDIHVYLPLPNQNLQLQEVIKIPYPIDNLSEDSDGNIIAAVFPRLPEAMAKFKDMDPSNVHSLDVQRQRRLYGADKIGKEPATAAMKITRVGMGLEGESWVVSKLIEDGEGEVLPASTTYVRDGRTGRVFCSSVVSEWIGVCEFTG